MSSEQDAQECDARLTGRAGNRSWKETERWL